VLAEVETDASIIGYGAARVGPEAAICIERFVGPYFLGQDPTRVERLAAVLRDAEILGPPMYFMEIPL
jgi:L-alanine-DL-glutamate epimerase-like enolase superfamily enzyme